MKHQLKRIVKTNSGYVEGIRTETYYKWLGIPFAKAPVGELRFQRALPVDVWEGVRRCDRFGPKPIQMAGGAFGEMMKSDTPESEDCLYLNVWAPRDDRNNGNDRSSLDNVKEENKFARRPVFVWFYGGGHHGGEASAPEYDLKSFAEHGIVAVSFNYRLGALGFYDFEEFDSNCGVSDMQMALRWVHENIACFGGDPKLVTIAGESAGATGVLAMMASPIARPLFKRAIVMSGLASNITRGSSDNKRANASVPAEERRQAAEVNTQRINNRKYLRRMGIKPENVGILKTIPVGKIAAGCMPLFSILDLDTPGIMAPGPVLDDLVTETPFEAISEGKMADKEILFGTCRDEGNLFSFLDICPKTWHEIETMLSLNGYEDKIDRFYELYCGSLNSNHQRYLKREENRIVKEINRDRMFWADTMKLAIEQSRHGCCYLYQFDYETPASRLVHLGATHTMDVGPALNTYDGQMNKLYKGVPARQLTQLHEEMHGAFVNFVKTGNPNPENTIEKSVTWPRFTEESWERMHFSKKSEVKRGKEREEVLELWREIELYK